VSVVLSRLKSSARGANVDGTVQVKVTSVTDVATGNYIYVIDGGFGLARRRLAAAGTLGVKVDYTVLLLWNATAGAAATVSAAVAGGGTAQGSALFGSLVVAAVSSHASSNGNVMLAAGMASVTATASAPSTLPPPPPAPFNVTPVALGVIGALLAAAAGSLALDRLVLRPRREARMQMERELAAAEAAEVALEAEAAKLPVFWGEAQVQPLKHLQPEERALRHKLARIVPFDAPHR